MRFYNGADKIKSLRIQLGLNQGDLEDEHISRGLISMIETNRREITYKVASRLADKFNDKAEERGLVLNITGEYLTRTEKEEAEIYCLSKLKNDDLTQEQFHEIFEIAEKYKLLQVKAKAYVALGDVNLKNKNYDDACINYDKSIKLYKKLYLNRELAYIYYQIGVTNFRMFKFQMAIVYFNASHYYSLIYEDNETCKKSLNALADDYLRVGNYELGLKTINECLSTIDSKDMFYPKALNTKAVCFYYLKDYQQSIDTYKKLLDKLLCDDDKDTFIGCIYTNLGANYCYINDFDESLKYFLLAEDFRKNFDKKRLGKTILERAKVYIKQKLFDKAIKTTEESLRHSEKYGNVEYLISGHNMLKDIYAAINDNERLEHEYLELIKLFKMNKNYINLKIIYDKLALIYLKQDKLALDYFL